MPQAETCLVDRRYFNRTSRTIDWTLYPYASWTSGMGFKYEPIEDEM